METKTINQIKIHCKYDDLINPALLNDYDKNRNLHSQEQIERLAELYSYHGIRHPIIYDPFRKVIAAGHGRKLAAIKAGIEKFPVVYQTFESDEALYAFVQADNAIATWAELDLSRINTDLSDLGPDFNLNMLGLKNFTLDLSEKIIDYVNKGDENSEWVGMPTFEQGSGYIQISILFSSEEEREKFAREAGLEIKKRIGKTWVVYK